MSNESKITSIDDPAPAAKTAKAVVLKPSGGPVGGAELSGEMVTLTIHASSEFDGREAVPIGHNERVYQIPRGKPCVVPEAVAQIVADAVTERFDPGPDGQVIAGTQPRFAYSITPA